MVYCNDYSMPINLYHNLNLTFLAFPYYLFIWKITWNYQKSSLVLPVRGQNYTQVTVCLMRRYDPRVDGPTAMPKLQGRQEDPRARRLYPPTRNPTEWHELHGHQSHSTDYDPPGAPWRPEVARNADVVGKGRSKFMPWRHSTCFPCFLLLNLL